MTPAATGWRTALAAGIMLAGLAGAYEAAWRLVGATPLGMSAPSAPGQSAPAAPAPALPPGPAPTAAPATGGADEAPPSPLPTEQYRVAATTRRYVGTISGKRVTATLTWVRPDSAVGSFYYWRQPGEFELATASRHHPGTLRLARVYPAADPPAGYWQVTGRPGPTLRGYWHAAGQRRPFCLRENYAHGLRYAIENLTVTERYRISGQAVVLRHGRDFLRVLAGPAGGGLARQLCPGRAGQRARALDAEGPADCTSTLHIQLNDFGLLSYNRYEEVDALGGGSDGTLTFALVDLRAGRWLRAESQLRPDYEQPLRRLLTHHLLHDPGFNHVNCPSSPEPAPTAWRWRTGPHPEEAVVELPEADFSFTPTGLQAAYSRHYLFSDAGSYYPSIAVLVPYAELRPLVRPGTPLARMLRARGVW